MSIGVCFVASGKNWMESDGYFYSFAVVSVQSPC